MQKISNISFKGIEQKHLDTTPSVSNPIETQELGEKALPMGDKSLAVSPTLPSEYLNEADLARYKKVQQAFAEILAKKFKVPVENILVRLPEIVCGNSQEMLRLQQYGGHNPITNLIEIIPIKEMLSVMGGGDEVAIAHESLHGYFHNLRRAYARQIPQEQLGQETTNLVLNQMREGEHGFIFREFAQNANGEFSPKIMQVPLLSASEREVLTDAINTITADHIDINLQTANVKLNDAGEKHIAETLSPKLGEFYDTVVAKPGQKDAKFKEQIIDYINSFFTRRNLLLSNMLNPQVPDVEESLQTPLTEVEVNLAKNTMGGILSTQEGNYIHNITGVNAEKTYFSAYEELLAKGAESLYRGDRIDQKIETIESQGLKPSESLLAEKTVVQNNYKLNNLAWNLSNLERRIISAPKDSEKIKALNALKLERDNYSEMYGNHEITKYLESKGVDFISTSASKMQDMVENLPLELKEKLPELNEVSKKMFQLQQKINQMDTPINFLADTCRNKRLKLCHNLLMQKIQGLASKCDIPLIPQSFYKSIEECVKSREKQTQLFEKWVRRLRV